MDPVGTGLKTLAMLLLVLGCIVLILYGMKKIPLFRQNYNGRIRIDILSTLHLSQKEKVAIIEVAGEKIVLGITPAQITYLTSIPGLYGNEQTDDTTVHESDSR